MEAYDLREKIQEAALFSFEEGSPEPFEALDRLLEAVEETRQTQGLAEISGEALSQQPLDPVRYYLHGFALVKLGQADQATKVLQSLCSRLEQEGKWGLLGRLLPRILDAAPSVEVARCLAKAGETAGVGQLDLEAIEKAYTLYPDEERLAYLMGELEAQRNEGERALDYWADSLDGFVGLRRYDRLEEALLKVAASENPEHQAHVVHVLKRLAEQNQWNRFGSFLEIAHDGLLASGQLPEVWKIVLNHFAKAPEEAGLRKWIRQLAPEVFPAAEGILDLLGRSGILDAQMRAETALKQLQTLLEFAPGFHVLHDSWGIGRIRLNDGDTLVVDFRTTKNHRMKLTLARRALTVIPPDDLRVLHSEDPAELKRLLRENPSEVIVRALRTMKGEATTQDLRRNLVGQGIVSAGSWTSWWKEARASLESDDRIDLTQSFRQLYRLKTEAADEDRMPLPAIEPKRGIRPNLNLIRRFLEQHPDEAGRAARLYTPILERWAKDDRTSAEDKMAVGLQLERWRQEIRADFMDALRACLESNVEMSSFADLEDQKLLTRVALENEGLWKRGAVMALSSRSPEVREMARERMRQDPEESRSVLNELLADPIERPLASLAAFDLTLEDPPEPFAPDPWPVSYTHLTL
ncbi:MAG: hypothetical protein QUU85_00675, partial [Candidatus Eisenbacteria bacterium]|nr:hypothetical protein [Candidatus Eisenbacteria bacterium]